MHACRVKSLYIAPTFNVSSFSGPYLPRHNPISIPVCLASPGLKLLQSLSMLRAGALIKYAYIEGTDCTTCRLVVDLHAVSTLSGRLLLNVVPVDLDSIEAKGDAHKQEDLHTYMYMPMYVAYKNTLIFWERYALHCTG